MLDIEKAKIRLKRAYRKKLISLGMAKRVVDKIEPLLPKGWNCLVDDFGWLYISKQKRNTHASEFRMACNLVEDITEEKVDRMAASKDSLSGSCSILKGYRYLHIEIDVCGVDGCKIEQKEKMETYYVASPGCLGFRQKEVR